MKPAAAQRGLFRGAIKHLVTGAPEWSGSRIAKLGSVPAAAAGAPTPGLGVTVRGAGGSCAQDGLSRTRVFSAEKT